MTFTYTVTDGRLLSEEVNNIVIMVSPVNDDPVAVDDAGFSTQEDNSTLVYFHDLLANDTDVEDDTLRINRVFDPVNGNIQVDGDRVVFTPLANYFGNAGFAYEVSDGNGGFDYGYVSISVVPDAGDLPVAVSDAFWEIDEDTFVDISPDELLANDVDADGDVLSFVSASGPGVEQLADGTIRFTPAPNANGQFTLDYSITDPSGPAVSGNFIVDVRPVDDPPRAASDEVEGIEDQPLVISLASLVFNDGDPDGHAIAITDVGGEVGGAAEFDGVGNVVFTPEANRYGAARFEYTLTDGTGDTDTTTVFIELAPNSDPPVVSVETPLNGVEEMLFEYVIPDAAFSDADGDALQVSVESAGGGSLPSWLTFDEPSMLLRGLPPRDFAGVVKLQVVARDAVFTTRQSVDLVIADVNDRPVALGDEGTTYQNTPTTINLSQNDSDVDGNLDPFALSIQSAPVSGTIENHGNGIVTYTPNDNFLGTDTFTYVATDADGLTSLPATVSVAVESEDSVGPDVVGLFVDSNEWAPVFRDRLDGGFGGSALGHPMPLSGSSDTLPWSNMNILRVQFSEDVSGSIDATDFSFQVAPGFLALNADGSVSDLPTIQSFEYDSGSRVATLHLNGYLTASVFDLVVAAAGVHDATGNQLMGGGPADQFSYRFLVLPGDTTNSRIVGVDDLIPIRQQQTGFMLHEFVFSYTARADLDGRSSGNPAGLLTIIDVEDLQVARQQQNALILEIAPPLSLSAAADDHATETLDPEELAREENGQGGRRNRRQYRDEYRRANPRLH